MQNVSTSSVTVNDDGVFGCPKCDKVFSRAANRDRHLQGHESVPTHQCPTCSQRFHRADVLAKHVARHQTQSRSIESFPSSSKAALASRTHVDDPDSARSVSELSSTASTSAFTLPSSRSLAAINKVERACTRCNKAKARCDGQKPACGRCVRLAKDALCTYASTSAGASGAGANSEPNDTERASDALDAMSASPPPSATTVQPAKRTADPITSFSQHFEDRNDQSQRSSQALSRTSIPTAPSRVSLQPPATQQPLQLHHQRHQHQPPPPQIASTSLTSTFPRLVPETTLPSSQEAANGSVAPGFYDLFEHGAFGRPTAVSPASLDWLLQGDVADEDVWMPYLGDPGVPLLGSVSASSAYLPSNTMSFDFGALPTASDLSAHSHLPKTPLYTSNQSSQHLTSIPQPANVASGRAVQEYQTAHTGTLPNAAALSAMLHPSGDGMPAATSGVLDARPSLDRARSGDLEAKRQPLLRSASPSDESDLEQNQESHQMSAKDVRPGVARSTSSTVRSHSFGRSGIRRNKRRRRDSASSNASGTSSSSELDRMERANRELAVQTSQHRITFTHKGQQRLDAGHPGYSPSNPSPEDMAAGEAMQADSPASSSRSNRRRKRTQWPSAYRPKATDSGAHLSLLKVCRASPETLVMENSFVVPALTESAKERMINEFRYCEVDPQDLLRIQTTLRNIDTATLNLFLQLYFEHYDRILPFLHRGSFDPDLCDPLLLAAITSLGALCSKAENAFAYSLLCSSLCHAVSYKLIGVNHLRGRYLPSIQTLLLIYALWRNLGDPAKLEYVEGFRNIILTMARRCRLFDMPPNSTAHVSDSVESPEKAAMEWKNWIRNEELIRTGWALFVLDCDLSIAWDLPCVLSINELNSPMPSSDRAWLAESATTWAAAIATEDTAAGQRRQAAPLYGQAEGKTLSHLLRQAGQEASYAEVGLTTPLGQSILVGAAYNLGLSCWDLEQITDCSMMPTDGQGALHAASRRMEHLFSGVSKRTATAQAQILLSGAQLRLLVSFRKVQIMSGRKGARRARAAVEDWMRNSLCDEAYRRKVFEAASKIFALCVAGDAGSDSMASTGSKLGGAGAENSLLFYASVCLILLCRYLSRPELQQQLTLAALNQQAKSSTAGSASSLRRDAYYVPNVGALTHSSSIRRLLDVSIYQGLRRSLWPLGSSLGKVLAQCANEVTASSETASQQ
ncbi:hypothetical protein BCV70DRAFT_67004 [Testicularia cyperi]|uniref:Zn(2)-C6 fungal-type domain-containing protein n=1 Tax=Testicularia cyperi TaxID=1882483 RepID=A0A317XGV2_9BASI|nr:hypothetical protein BCV70DRAFT_67004 [Testicularia cyperi]